MTKTKTENTQKTGVWLCLPDGAMIHSGYVVSVKTYNYGDYGSGVVIEMSIGSAHEFRVAEGERRTEEIASAIKGLVIASSTMAAINVS